MRSRNPVLPPAYCFPDGEPHAVGGELYLYPSCDVRPGSYCSDRLFVAHSRDLSEWTVSGPAFASSQLDWPWNVTYPAGLLEAESYEELPAYIAETLSKTVKRFVPFRLYRSCEKRKAEKRQKEASDRLLYAPDAVTRNGKTYLFFCTSDGCEGVAVSGDPAGPFTDPVRIRTDRSGTPITGIDPGVFRDDDGRAYLYWGQIHSFGAELTEDLTRVKEDTIVKGLLTEKEHGFHEGSSMRKINGIYYYIFADTHRGKPTALGYATSKSPLGPFEYQGILVDNDGCDPETWNNHGSIECVGGQWYVFYHRSTGNSRYLRRMCAEPITVGADGRIREVPVTSIGMGEPYRAGEPLYGYQACRVENAYIDGEDLVVKQGTASAGYRYVDGESAACPSIACEADGSVSLSHRVDGKGELTISIEAHENARISFFTLGR